MSLGVCNIKANVFPKCRDDFRYNAQILEALREFLCNNESRVYFRVVAGNIPGTLPGAPADPLQPECDGDSPMEIYDNGFIVWSYTALTDTWGIVAARTFGTPTIVKVVEAIAISTTDVTLPIAVSKEQILLVTADQVEYDHADEALIGNTSWTVSGTTLTFTADMQFTVVRVKILI